MASTSLVSLTEAASDKPYGGKLCEGAEGAIPDGTLSAGFLVRTFFDPKRGARGGTQVVVTHSDVEVMTSGYVGGLVTGAHQ